MNPDVLKSTLTSMATVLLSMGGGYLVGGGYVTSDQWATISAGLLTLVGVIAYKAAQHTVAQSVSKVNDAGGLATGPSVPK